MPRYLVIVIMDGVRMSETIGTPANIPNIMNLANNGSLLTGVLVGGGGIATETINGHACILTGKFEALLNDGSQSPSYPPIFHEYLQPIGTLSSEPVGFTDRVKFIASKDKLWCLQQCSVLYPEDYNSYQPFINCGFDGVGGGGYRADWKTHQIFKTLCLGEYPPVLSMVSYCEADTQAHAHNWAGYITKIKAIDTYIGEILSLISVHPLMAGNTNFIIASDHGRHADPNYWDHGGLTTEEKNIMFVAAGPSFKAGYTSAVATDAIDIANTAMAVLE